MGTNFYMMTKSKEVSDKWFGYDRELTDFPDWGYSIHIAKTSCGWHTLFQEHDKIHSVNDIRLAVTTGDFILYDEYGTTYSWDEFVKRVVEHGDENSLTHIDPDPKMPNFEDYYGSYSLFCSYRKDYYRSIDGYEFCKSEFS